MTAKAAAPRRRARANGEGTIRKRPDGRWEGKLTLDTWVGGKQQRKSVYGKTRAEAAQKLAELQVEHSKGAVVGSGKIPLITYLIAFARQRSPYIRPSTRINHDRYLAIVGAQPQAKVMLCDFRARHAEQLYVALSQEYSDSVVTHIRIFINQALKDAVKNEILPSASAIEAKAPRREKTQVARALTEAEAKALLDVLRPKRLYTLVRVLLALGLRIGEALGLTWDDLDPAKQTLRIERTMQRIGKHANSGPTKTRAGRRTLYLSPELLKLLREWKSTLQDEALAPGYEKNNLIFPNINGRPAAYGLIRRDFQLACEQAGIGEVRLHDLRHTFATRLTLRGADPRTVSALMGHTDARVTLAIYTHAQAESSKAALMLMESAD